MNEKRILGFSGTRQGMDFIQRNNFRKFVREFQPIEFHYGGCIGADMDAHFILEAECPDCLLVLHPPTSKEYQYYKSSEEAPTKLVWKPARPYLVRNRDIVEASAFMLFAPYERVEILRSGTWATLRYCRKRRLPFKVLYPSVS